MTFHRRAALVVALATTAAACADDDADVEAAATPTTEATATTEAVAPTVDAEGDSFLVVADPEAHAIHVYDTDDHDLIGTVDDVHLAEHPGFVPLIDGRVLFTDGDHDELIVLDPATAEIESRTPLGGAAVHLAVDPDQHFAAVSTSDADGFTLVDLEHGDVVDVPLTTGEPGIAFGGEPLSVLHRNDEPGRVEAFPVEALLDGDLEPAAHVDIDPLGHGEVVTAAGERLGVATDAGVELVDLGAGGPTYAGSVPWDQGDRTGGRGYFFRLGPEGTHAFSYLRIVPEPQDDAALAAWERWGNDLYVADLEAATATRVELGPGLVYRFALSEDRAFYVRMHPDGDVLHVVDADPASGDFATVVDEVPLAPLAAAPVAGADPWEAESRRVAARGDGRRAYVSNGGEGTVSVIDVAAGEVTDTIEVPTPLHLGGYLVAIDPDVPTIDGVGR